MATQPFTCQVCKDWPKEDKRRCPGCGGIGTHNVETPTADCPSCRQHPGLDDKGCPCPTCQGSTRIHSRAASKHQENPHLQRAAPTVSRR